LPCLRSSAAICDYKAFDLDFKIYETQISQIYADKILNPEPIFTTRFARGTEDTELQS